MVSSTLSTVQSPATLGIGTTPTSWGTPLPFCAAWALGDMAAGWLGVAMLSLTMLGSNGWDVKLKGGMPAVLVSVAELFRGRARDEQDTIQLFGVCSRH